MTSLNKVTFIDPNHLPGLLFFYSTELLKKIQQMCEATEKITLLMSREVTFTVFPDSSLLFQENKKCPGKNKNPKSRIEVIIVEQGEPRSFVQSNGEGGQCKHGWVNV